tara:strand:+ start:675 stop:2621 length:1947 start_codon:yes stop_codon:yes gene_type:complete
MINNNIRNIINIKNKNDLLKYDQYNPIFYGNYLFEYLIIFNKINILKLQNYPINKLNVFGLNGFHLAAKYNKIEILNYFIKKYKNYIYNLSNNDSNFVHFINNLDSLLELLKQKSDVNWVKILTHYNNYKISPLDLIFIDGEKNLITFIINNFKIDYNNFKLRPSFFYLLNNNNLSKIQDKIKIFNLLSKNNKDVLNLIDLNGKNIIFYVNNIKYFKYFHSKNVNFDYYTPFETNHILIKTYEKEMYTNNFNKTSFIWNIIKDTHNFKEVDKNGNNLASLIIILLQNIQKKNYNLELDILQHNNEWNIINLDQKTPLDYLVKLNYNNFKSVLNNKKITLINNKLLKNNKWGNLLKKYPIKNCKLKKNKCFDIILKNYKYTHGNLFLSKFDDLCILFIELNKKYKNLYLPKSENNYFDTISSENYDNFLPYFLLNNFSTFPWVILYKNKNTYNIHKDLNNLILKNKDNHDYAVCFISLLIPGTILHANLLIFDYKKNTVERFEPFGNLYKMNDDLDIILEKNIKNFKYIKPKEYLPGSGFQTLSDELNVKNIKAGDIGGFCLAWCFWYLEHKLLNKDVNSKILVEKMIKKIKYSNLSFSEYIRNYANSINKLRYDYLEKLNIPKNIVSNINFSDDIINKINNSIINYFK